MGNEEQNKKEIEIRCAQKALHAYSIVLFWVYFRMAMWKNPCCVCQEGAPGFCICVYKRKNKLIGGALWVIYG